MLKILTVTAATLAMLSAAAAAESAAQGAAAAGSPGRQGSDRQVSGRQGSDRQVSAARGEQGLSVARMGGSKGHRSFPFDRLFRQRTSATLVLRRGANFATRDKHSWRTAR